jgi:hypothetical protein
MLATITGTFIMLVYSLSCVQGIATLMSVVTGLTYNTCIILAVIAFTLITAFSGAKGVLITDTIMFAIFSVATLIGAGVIAIKAGGWMHTVTEMANYQGIPGILAAGGNPSYFYPTTHENMIWAVGLPYSPLDRKQQKAVVDICTKELLTPKGLRSLSPKSGLYHPFYNSDAMNRERALHNGLVWPSTITAYSRAYMNVYKYSGISFMERLLVGFEAEMDQLTIGTLNEMYDGNPPYKGHGGMSYAPSVAAVISVMDTLKKYKQAEAEQEKKEAEL